MEIIFEINREVGKNLKSNEDFQIPGQIELFEFLAENYEKIPERNLRISGVIDTKTLSDFDIQSTYRDIFLIINMIDDYVRILNIQKEKSSYVDYMISQFERISYELAQQIKLDKEKMYKRCRKKQINNDSVGEDAMILTANSYRR